MYIAVNTCFIHIYDGQVTCIEVSFLVGIHIKKSTNFKTMMMIIINILFQICSLCGACDCALHTFSEDSS